MVPETIPSPYVGDQKPDTLSADGKPTQRRPTLVRKREETSLDQDDQTTAWPPSKKARVAFNEDVEVNVVDEPWDKTAELIKEEVRRALQRHANGDSEGYNKIVQVYATEEPDAEPPSAEALKHYTAALLSNVALLNRSTSRLVQLVLKIDWVRRESGFVSLYTKFLGNLVSAQGMWLRDVMERLVRMFVAVPNPKDLGDIPFVPAATVRQRLHEALRMLLKLVPTASSVLTGVLNNQFPSASNSKKAHIRYVHNLLAIIAFAPELQSDILSLITERIVKIDVQVQKDIGDLEEGEELVRAISQSRDKVLDDSDGEQSEDESDEEIHEDKRIAANVEKLDLVLDIMFEHYAKLFSDPKSSSTGLDILLSHFSNLILPTYRSRHTQFLIFRFVQLSPERIDIFLGLLLRNAFDKSRAGIIRQASAAYLASFLARGLHVSQSIVREVFDYISDQLTALRAQYLPTCRGPNPGRYSLYYALTQALLYIFCFRWRDLVTSADDGLPPSPPFMPYDTNTYTDEEAKQHPNFPPTVKETLHQNIFCNLNPLRVCAPVIAQEFARISFHLGIMYVHSLLEANRRVPLAAATAADARESALSRRKGDEWQRLDGYFPFDPYRLPRSKRWTEGYYREWTPIPGLDDEDENSENEEEEDEDGDEGSEGTGTEGEDVK